MNNTLFDSVRIGNLELNNRIVRSATYEGAADSNGVPTDEYFKIYKKLSTSDVGMIITGFAFISKQGRAMQPAQAGIDLPENIDKYWKVTSEMRSFGTPFIMQLAHTGRQTRNEYTDSKPVSSSNKRSIYFNQKVRKIQKTEISEIIDQFSKSSYYAKSAGFDGIQLHAAHGYLLHQFILPETNKLKNEFGVEKETGIGTKLIKEIFFAIKDKCGDDFPVLIKISGDHDLSNGFSRVRFDSLICFLNDLKVDAIEISYGTMDYALNIFRGDLDIETVLKYNPIFKNKSSSGKWLSKHFIKNIIAKKFKEFEPAYNLQFAERAKQLTNIPIISVGGFRSKNIIESAIESGRTDLISLSRPFIAEPDLMNKIRNSKNSWLSACVNCNRCVFMCDSGKPTRCYTKFENKGEIS